MQSDNELPRAMEVLSYDTRVDINPSRHGKDGKQDCFSSSSSSSSSFSARTEPSGLVVVRDPVRLARGVCNGDKYKFDGKGERERETEGWGGLVGCRSDGLQVAKEDYQEGAGEALTEGWQSDGEGPTRVVKRETDVG
ncbi:hypothetical protein K0M31_003072 [Melipona bicolor]|uniref:Uncharacterized protein n=1 Tax=Melipona bicolor TaxID=60889 RepID=A0AA40G0S3_9HYME|nr:hypothetical protein K0M31_003072 [Melipona bicolor]